MTTTSLRTAGDALRDRLAAAVGVLRPDLADPHAIDAGSLFDELVTAAREAPDESVLWLLVTALTGALPTVDLVLSCRRHLELNPQAESAAWLLSSTMGHAARHGEPLATLQLVTDQVLADVDFTARHGLMTGIQRVVRETLPLLVREKDVLPVAWTAGAGALRLLSDEERHYLLDWPGALAPTPPAPEHPVLVVPWQTTLLLPEVPFPHQSDPLVCLARFSGNRVVLVGYDCIPAGSADLVPNPEREKFGRYLELVKHSDTVAGISVSAAAEFEGFVSALRTQGIAGPTVVACPLASHSEPVRAQEPLPLGQPLVLTVGSLDIRKNQLAVVVASELLWRAGHEFSLLLVGGGGGRPRDLMDLIEKLQDQGRPIIWALDATEDYLHQAYASARFTVFPTLHEGFGLPIVESLSYGVPVITSDYGAMRECAEGQGALLVDPQDVDAIAEAMRSLLADDDLLASLAAEAAARQVRTWDDYAHDLWSLISGSGPLHVRTPEASS